MLLDKSLILFENTMDNSFTNKPKEEDNGSPNENIIDLEPKKNWNDAALEKNVVIVSNLPFSTKFQAILQFCQAAGEVVELRLSTHDISKRSKGWA